MNIIHGYRNDQMLRDSFNALAEQTFGLNFEGWYQNGFWGDNYDPHSIIMDGKVVANVSVNRCDLTFGGRTHRILQLGTVMTDSAYRGKGLGRAIMEHLEPVLAQADGVYLFANDSVTEFYPRFGFRRGREVVYSRPVNQEGLRSAEQIPMDGPEGWDKLAAAMEKSAFPCGCAMTGNPGLIFFYVSQFMQDAVWYIPELDAWVIAEEENGALTIHNIFGGADITIDSVVRAFGPEVTSVSLGFAPGDREGWETAELLEEDTHFFVRGEAFREFEDLDLRIPSLSHA